MSSPLDIARDEWPALRWREARRAPARIVGVGRVGWLRVKVIVWDGGDVTGCGPTVSGLPLRAALRELRGRIA